MLFLVCLIEAWFQLWRGLICFEVEDAEAKGRNGRESRAGDMQVRGQMMSSADYLEV